MILVSGQVVARINVFIYEFWVFCSGVVEYFILVGYDTVSLGSDISF